MKANELRIDNYVFDDENTVVKIEKICSDRHIIWSESDKFEFSKENDKQNMYVCDIINPIPLTEEILLKIKGFELTYDSPKSKIIELYNHEKMQAVKVRFQKESLSFEVSFDYQVWSHIKHLHTLQNCFKAKYNEELEINL